jgi:hypothetical membrane protein
MESENTVLIERSKGTQMIIWIGYIAPLIALVGIFIAVLLSPIFNWADNALSDLGHWTRIDIGSHPFLRALIFNLGLITTGILLIIITIILMNKLHDLPTIIAIVPFLLAEGFLAVIGIFSEDTWVRLGNVSLHYIASLGFFITFPFAMWFMGVSWFRFPSLRWFSIISFLLPVVSIYLWWGTFSGMFPWSGVALPELLSALTAIVWFWVFLKLAS